PTAGEQRGGVAVGGQVGPDGPAVGVHGAPQDRLEDRVERPAGELVAAPGLVDVADHGGHGLGQVGEHAAVLLAGGADLDRLGRLADVGAERASASGAGGALVVQGGPVERHGERLGEAVAHDVHELGGVEPGDLLRDDEDRGDLLGFDRLRLDRPLVGGLLAGLTDPAGGGTAGHDRDAGAGG